MKLFGKKIKHTFFKSLRFRILLILIVIGIVPSIIVENVIVNSYENRAVDIRTVNVGRSASGLREPQSLYK